MVSLSLVAIDMTILATAVPSVVKDLGGFEQFPWLFSIYVLATAVTTPLYAKVADRLGRKPVMIAGIVAFLLGSLLCGLAWSLTALIVFRAIQGIGAGAIQPMAMTIVSDIYTLEERAVATSYVASVWATAAIVGPTLGGLFADYLDWRLIFLINVPLALAVLYVSARHVPESRNPAAAREIDVTGVLTGAAGLGGLTYGFTAWPMHGPGSAQVLVSLAVGVLGLAAFVLTERRSAHPMLPLSVFSSRPFTGANLVTFVVYAANGGVFFLVVLNLQVVAGFSPLASGIAMLPVTALMLLLSARAGMLGQRIGPRIPMTVGPIVCAVALVLLSLVGAGASYWTDVLPAVVIFGLGLSLLVAPLTATALGALDDRYAGIASGVNNAVARAAGLLAVAVLPLAAGLGDGSLTAAPSLHPVYRNAMMICAALMVVGGAVAWLTVPRQLPAHPEPCSFCDPASPPRRVATRA